jgi:peptidoglycan/xylan/chitin deacetylase (PgdA/CDA1 family)
MDDLRPYRHEGSSLVEIPIQWTLDDAAYFWFDASAWQKTISTADDVRSIWEGEFRGYREHGGAFVLTMHPQVIGRPYRLELLDHMLGYVAGHEDVWVATCAEIAARVPET